MADKHDDSAKGNPTVPASVGQNFTSTIHRRPNVATDPTKTTLPKPFVVFITGAGRGIGAETACSYAKAGASGIVICARRVSDLQRVAEKISQISPSTKCITAACDVGSEESVKAVVNTVEKEFGRLDVLVNNAGSIGDHAKNIGDPSPDFKMLVDVNLLGTFYPTHYFLPLLLKSSNGAKAIINISSVASHMAWTPYGLNICKLAINRFTECLAGQYGGQGLVAYAVHPGGVMTENAAAMDLSEEIKARK